MDIRELEERGLIQRIRPAKDLAEKEFGEADYDLERAREALGAKDYKWAILKSYYSAFHAAKGMMFLAGFREKAHFAVAEYLGILSSSGKLENQYVNDFKAAMSARQAADYQYDYDESRAETLVRLAEEFIARMKKLRHAKS